jgi:hypothetical protein
LVKDIKLYVEGGGKGTSKNATIRMQQGFDSFFKELKDTARHKNISFRIIPSSDTKTTYEDFMRSIRNSPESFNLLLVDSDEAIDKGKSARAFLQEKHIKWDLKHIDEERCHLMVQIMESWFIADVDALKKFYGQGFKESVMPKTKNVETIKKDAVEKALKAATAKTQKEQYQKIKHGGKLLELIDPNKVCEAAQHCKKLFKVIAETIE